MPNILSKLICKMIGHASAKKIPYKEGESVPRIDGNVSLSRIEWECPRCHGTASALMMRPDTVHRRRRRTESNVKKQKENANMLYGDPIVVAATRHPPFDISKHMTGSDGNDIRFMVDPRANHYLVLPSDFAPEGMLPPQEYEVRAALLEMKLFTDRLITFGFFGRLFRNAEFKQARIVASEKQRVLMNLVNGSPEHKAAIRRIVNAMPDGNGGPEALKDYVR